MLMPPPHGLLRGKTDRSRSWTRTPFDASAHAAVAPAGPAPTTTTASAGEDRAIIDKIVEQLADSARDSGLRRTASKRRAGVAHRRRRARDPRSHAHRPLHRRPRHAAQHARLLTQISPRTTAASLTLVSCYRWLSWTRGD